MHSGSSYPLTPQYGGTSVLLEPFVVQPCGWAYLLPARPRYKEQELGMGSPVWDWGGFRAASLHSRGHVLSWMWHMSYLVWHLGWRHPTPQYPTLHTLTSSWTNVGGEYSHTRHVTSGMNPGQEKPLQAQGAWG